jgi:hypothetical protein
MGNKDALRLPVVSLGAEHLVIGHLLCRDILAYKAPPNNEGYDLICIHPDPRQTVEPVRVQVKSRYQTDSPGERKDLQSVRLPRRCLPQYWFLFAKEAVR